MSIKVLFFGATADVTGKREIKVDLPVDFDSGEILSRLLIDYPKLRNHKLLFSINQQYATGEEIVRDGDELAIFTAVSGG